MHKILCQLCEHPHYSYPDIECWARQRCYYCGEWVTYPMIGHWRFELDRPRGQQCDECRREELRRWLRKFQGVNL
jgi:hypothetical protein